jgi:hypothetical protein
MNLYSPLDIDYTIHPSNNWTCPPCLKEIFPFHLIEETREFLSLISSNPTIDPTNFEELIFNPFDTNDDNGILSDIDPDSNFYNAHQPSPKSDYIDITNLNKKLPN